MSGDRGLFITVEGGEGSGKSTAIQLLKEWFKKQGKTVLITREPGGVKVSERIREVLVNEEMEPLTEAMLFAASRFEIINRVIIPALKDGTVVICDRFVDSSFVYQGMVRGLGLETVKRINQPILDLVYPDVTLYFDIKPEVGLERIRVNHRETNKFDNEMLSFHYKVRESYQKLSQMDIYKHRIKTINADQTPKEVVSDCENVLKEFI